MMALLQRRTADGLRWYQIVYRLAYRLGLIFWQRATPPADLVRTIEGPAALKRRVRSTSAAAPDMVPNALTAARHKARAAGVAPRFVEGDVTRLHELRVGDGYNLLLDFGCFHTLPEDRRPGYVTSVSRIAAPGATLMLFGFKRPPKAAPMHAGITVDEVRQRFGEAGWRLRSAGPATTMPST